MSLPLRLDPDFSPLARPRRTEPDFVVDSPTPKTRPAQFYGIIGLAPEFELGAVSAWASNRELGQHVRSSGMPHRQPPALRAEFTEAPG